MTTKLTVLKDSNGNVIYAIPFSDNGYDTTLAPSVVQSLTVPADAQIALFSYSSGSDVFVDPITTAALPGASFAKTSAELNPVMRPVSGVTTLSFISPAAAYVKVNFYTLLTLGVA